MKEDKMQTTILRTFKGGSGSSTNLIENAEGVFVRKEAFGELGLKLKKQYSWLEQMTSSKKMMMLPKLVGCGEENGAFYYDMEYDPSFVSFESFIAAKPVEYSCRVIGNIVSYVHEHIHERQTFKCSPMVLGKYISDKIEGKISATRNLVAGFEMILNHEKLIINDVEYRNLPSVLNGIRQNKSLMDRLSRHNACTIHGDLTIENILIRDENNFLLLDPNGENYIAGPAVEYSKLYQSLHSHYEELCLLGEVVVDGNRINYKVMPNLKQQQLFDYLQGELKKILSVEDYFSLVFHEAIHFSRLLPYRARSNPATIYAFYATMVKLFNQFYLEGLDE